LEEGVENSFVVIFAGIFFLELQGKRQGGDLEDRLGEVVFGNKLMGKSLRQTTGYNPLEYC
jgi:hypothetical protein